MGNLEYKGDSLKGDTDFVYNSLNQLIRSTFAGVETLYTYDDNGSLKTRKTGDKTITYDWENDGENRLVGIDIVEGNETASIDYEYNENGIRVGQTVNGVETSYLIDELQPYAQVLEEYDASGNLQAAYTYGEDLISRNGQFYHKDGLGSTRLLTDALGGVSESYNYDAYGNLITGNGSENPYLFAGEQRDVETGLDYLRARYYDPTLGRFISRDAYQGSLNDPMSQHKYQYAHANPVVNIDPSGYFTLTEILSAVKMSSILGAGSGAIIGGVAEGWKGAARGALIGAILAPMITLGTILGGYIVAALGGPSPIVSTAYIGAFLTVFGIHSGIRETITAQTDRQRLASIVSLILVGAGILGARPQFSKFKNSYARRGTFINKGKPPTNPGERAEIEMGKYLADRLKIDIIKVDPQVNPATGRLSSRADYQLRSPSGKTLELKTRTTTNKESTLLRTTRKNKQSENQVLVVEKGKFTNKQLVDVAEKVVGIQKLGKGANPTQNQSQGLQKDRIYIFEVDANGNYSHSVTRIRPGVRERLW